MPPTLEFRLRQGIEKILRQEMGWRDAGQISLAARTLARGTARLVEPPQHQRRATARAQERAAIAARTLAAAPTAADIALKPPEAPQGEQETGAWQEAVLDYEEQLEENQILRRILAAALRTKVSKDSVRYRPRTGPEACGNCIMFHPGQPGESGRCDLVEGEINPSAVCDRWEQR